MKILFIFLFLKESIDIHGAKGIFYESKNYFGNYPKGFYPYFLRQEYMNIKINGILKWQTEIEGDITQNSNPLKPNHIFFSLKNPFIAFTVGEQNIFLESNSLLLSNIYSEGIKGKINFENLKGEFLYSRKKGKTQYKRFRGNNSQGPFHLDNPPIVPESEKIKIIKNGNYTQLKRGIDYEIDYSIGDISFINRIIKEDEIIEVTYETQEEFFKEIYGISSNIYFIGYSEVNLRGKGTKEGNMGFNFFIPLLRYGNITILSAFDKYTNKLGAYGAKGKFNFKEIKINGYSNKYFNFYKPIEEPYITKGGITNSVDISYKSLYYTRYEFINEKRNEKNYKTGISLNTISYSFCESFLKDEAEQNSSLNTFTLNKKMRNTEFKTEYAFGKEKIKGIIEEKSSVNILKIKINSNFSNFYFDGENDFKLSSNYKEENTKINLSFYDKKINLYTKGEYFINSEIKGILAITSGYRVKLLNSLETTGNIKREYKTLSENNSRGSITDISKRFTFSIKRNSVSTFVNLKEAKGNNFYFNYINYGGIMNVILFKNILTSYSLSLGKSKNIKDKKDNLIVSKSIKNFLLSYEYYLALKEGKNYFDTLKVSSKLKYNKFSLNYSGIKKSFKVFLINSDSILKRENYFINMETKSINLTFSKDLLEGISIISGINLSEKIGYNTYLSDNFLKFKTIYPLIGAMGKIKDYLTVKGKIGIENSITRNINYGRKETEIIFSSIYKILNLSLYLKYTKFLVPEYGDFKFSFNGEIKF
ncbi:MAG: hypothetical protein QXP52_00790 [Candidatus Aenigmatarchaeota archaeon]